MVYYRIIDTEDGYAVEKLSESLETSYAPADFALPVKIYDKELAQEVWRKMTYGEHDEHFVRGVVEGILLMNRDSVEYDP